MWLIKNNMS